MSELQTTNQNQLPSTGVKGLSTFLNSDGIKSKFTEILGQKGVGFISSVLSVVSSSTALASADQNSIYTAALLAASLDLPINQNLGLAYIVPYKTRQPDGTYKQMAQFQLGYKGFLQLAQRSGQFKTINSTDVKEGEILSWDRMSGELTFNWIQDSKERLSKKTVGYLSYFKLLNGFENSFYMTIEEIEAHAKKYSQTYKQYGTGLWKDEFDGMAKKTVTKLNLSKNAPLSIEMQRAVVSDQAVIKNDNFVNSNETFDVETEYVDHQEVALDVEAVNEAKQRARIVEHITNAKNLDSLEKVRVNVDPESDLELFTLYDDKARELKNKK
jgi:recombination protein RecT